MDNIDYKAKVGFVPAGDGGRVTIVLSFASESPSLLGAEVPVYARVHPVSAIFPSQRRRIVAGPQACGAKNALAKDVPAKERPRCVGRARLDRLELAQQDGAQGRGQVHEGLQQVRSARRRRDERQGGDRRGRGLEEKG